MAEKSFNLEFGTGGLRAVMEETMTKIMFAIPSDLSIRKVVITPECVDGAMPRITRNKSNPRKPLRSGE